GLPAEAREEIARGEDDYHRDDLRRGEAPGATALGVAAEELEDEPGGRVEDRVGEHDLSAEALAGSEPEEEEENQEAGERLVELARVQRDVERRSHVSLRVGVGERHRPGHACRLAVAASGEEAAEAADGLSEHDAGGEDVGRGPGGKLIAPHEVPR